MMNTSITNLRKGMMTLLVAAAGSMLLSSCLKTNDNPNSSTPVAELMAFNLVPDQPGAYITLSGNSLTQTPLTYTSYTGVYLNVYPGDRTVQSYTSGTNAMLATGSWNFEQNKYYSLFVVGDSGNYRNVITNDNLDSLTAISGSGYIRYINAITDTVNHSQVTITAGSNNVINESAAFANVSAFKPVTAGNVSITVKSGTAIDSSRTITVEQNKIYTVLLTGVPGTTDDLKKVQIKYIVNGLLTGNGSN